MAEATGENIVNPALSQANQPVNSNSLSLHEQMYRASLAALQEAEKQYQQQAAQIPISDPQYDSLRKKLDGVKARHHQAALRYYESELGAIRDDLGDRLIRPEDTLRVLDRMSADQAIADIDPDADVYYDIQRRLSGGETFEQIAQQARTGIAGRVQIEAQYKLLSAQPSRTPQEQEELDSLKKRIDFFEKQGEARELIGKICDLRQIVHEATAQQIAQQETTDAQLLKEVREGLQITPSSLSVDQIRQQVGDEVKDLSDEELGGIIYWALNGPTREVCFTMLQGIREGKRPYLYNLLLQKAIALGKLPNPKDPDPQIAAEARNWYKNREAWFQG